MAELKQATAGLKNSMKGAIAWAKKNPAIAALLIGGVILLVFVTKKNSAGIQSLSGSEGGTTSTDDLLGGGGGFGLMDIPKYSTPLGIGDLITPPIVVPSSKPQLSVIPTGVIYPGEEEEDDKEFYLKRSEELEELAGTLPIGDQRRGLLADAARWYGIASLSDTQQAIYTNRIPAWQSAIVTTREPHTRVQDARAAAKSRMVDNVEALRNRTPVSTEQRSATRTKAYTLLDARRKLYPTPSSNGRSKRTTKTTRPRLPRLPVTTAYPAGVGH